MIDEDRKYEVYVNKKWWIVQNGVWELDKEKNNDN